MRGSCATGRRLNRRSGTPRRSSNRDLGSAVAQGRFREDLHYRLNVFPIVIPALRERADDIRVLVEYLVQRYAQAAGKKIRQIDGRTLESLVCLRLAGKRPRVAERDRASVGVLTERRRCSAYRVTRWSRESARSASTSTSSNRSSGSANAEHLQTCAGNFGWHRCARQWLADRSARGACR